MSTESSNLLFVYGTLRSGFKHLSYQYISKYFSLIGNAKVKGYLYDLGEYPAAKPTTDEAFIIGELYAIKNEAEFYWAIEQLDDYEGLNVVENKTPLYYRDLTTVYINNSTIPAWVYWFNGDVLGKEIIKSGDILDYKK
jgi:gamma-glutamylcyclotransferase (GGCT)/AIG2-like uncharacterized protein YtfP